MLALRIDDRQILWLVRKWLKAGVLEQLKREVEARSGELNLGTSFTNFSGGTLTGGTYEVSSILSWSGANVTTNAAAVCAMLSKIYTSAKSALVALHGELSIIDSNAKSGIVVPV